jgi:hypothetical protein
VADADIHFYYTLSDAIDLREEEEVETAQQAARQTATAEDQDVTGVEADNNSVAGTDNSSNSNNTEGAAAGDDDDDDDLDMAQLVVKHISRARDALLNVLSQREVQWNAKLQALQASRDGDNKK